MPKLKLTKSHIDALPTPDKGKRVTYFDTEQTGFCLRVSAEKKIYYVAKRGVNAKLQWVKLGEHGTITPDKARERAVYELSRINQGVNINAEKRAQRVKGITLGEVLERYFEERQDHLRPGTVQSYKSLASNHFSTWLKKPMIEITRDMVSKKHLDIAKRSGRAQANKCMRLLRLLYNHLSIISDDSMDNPVTRLKDARQWFKNERRTSIIRETDLKAWYEGVMAYNNPVVRDYILLLLFTGLRKHEGLKLQWEDIDMDARTFTVRAEVSKNHQAHTLPMSSFLFDLFYQRTALSESDWVFTGRKGNHLSIVQRAIKCITEKTGIQWTLHDLRRTFSTFAEQEVSYAILKRLLNHSQGADVTAGYLVITTEQLRAPMQKVTDRMLKAIRGKEARGKIIQFRT